jgi:uncharacterized protein (TIGR02001 family)
MLFLRSGYGRTPTRIPFQPTIPMKTIVLLFAALAPAAVLSAASTVPAYTVTTDFSYTSDYVFRGLKSAGNSFQPSIEVASGEFNAGLWTNQPITKNENDEVDLYAGYRWNLNSRFVVEGAATYYWYPEARSSLGQTGDTYELSAGASYDMAPLTPSLFYYHDFRLKADTLQAAVGHKMPLGGVSAATFETSVFAGSVHMKDAAPDAAGAPINESYSYYGLDVSIPYKLATNATFTVAGHYVRNRNVVPTAGTPKEKTWFSAGITIGF